MALTPIKVPKRSASTPITEGNMPTGEFITWLNNVLQQIAYALNQVLVLPVIQQALLDLDAATQAAQTAADSANAAAAGSQATADAAAREQALINSYITPASVVTYDGTLIQIAAHTRYYADGTSVAVSAGSVSPAGTGVRYVSYNDPSRAGGAVTYLSATTLPVQTGDRHNVGAITVPGAGMATGGVGPRPPGFIQP